MRTRTTVSTQILQIEELRSQQYWLRQELQDLPCDHPDLTGSFTCDECGAYVEDLNLIAEQDYYRVLYADICEFVAEHRDVAQLLPRRSEYSSY